jgi:hypothetical protein
MELVVQVSSARFQLGSVSTLFNSSSAYAYGEIEL